MFIENEIKLDFSDVLIVPKRSTIASRKDVIITRKFKFKHTNKEWIGVPIIASNLDTTGTINMAKTLSKNEMLTCLHKFYSTEEVYEPISNNELNNNFIAISIGMNYDSEYIKKINAPFICIDVANGYCEQFTELVKEIRQKFPTKIIIAGNVVTKEMTEQLILSGADIVKVGIGSGALCTTRAKTGVGFPQLSAIIECADAAHGLGGHVMADGGCTCPGDIVKAFGAGADFVMLGGMLTGYDETDGNIIEENGKKYKVVYGMSSDTAQKKYYNKVYTYRASEGRTTKVLYKEESVQNLIQEVLGGLRSACTYIGAKTLKNIPKCTTFIRVNNQINTSLIKNI